MSLDPATEVDDIHADIKAAMTEIETGAPAAEPVQVEETAAERQVREDAAGRLRDESGKFAAKDKPDTPVATPDGTTPPVKAETTPPTETPLAPPLAPPKSWSAERKADFVSLPRPMQEEILRHEGTVQEAKQTWETKAERLNRLDKVLEPHKQRWARDGIDESVAVNQLLAAQTSLETNPVEGLSYLFKSFGQGDPLGLVQAVAKKFGLGVHYAQGDGRQQNQGQEPRPQADPTVQALRDQVNQLTQFLTTQQQTEQQTRQQALLSEIAAFEADPAHMYFNNVRDEIAALVRIGDQKGDSRPIKERLKDAYDSACWANPTVRALVSKAGQANAATAAKQRVDDARRASGSVVGVPGPGQTVAVNGNASESIEDDIRAAMREVASRA